MREYNPAMHSTWSKLAANWSGFSPTAYWLGSKAGELSLTPRDPEDGWRKQDAITLLALFQELRDSQIQNVGTGYDGALGSHGIRITTTTGVRVFSGPSFNLEVTKAVLELKRDGISPFETKWFWYDTGSCAVEPKKQYLFFVVSNDAIVRENISFVDSPASGFDPSVFESLEGAEEFWFNESQLEEAQSAYWYRKFSQETRTGQLMLLRPGKPLVPYFQNESLTVSVASFRVLRQMRNLLIAVVIVLGLIAVLLAAVSGGKQVPVYVVLIVLGLIAVLWPRSFT